MSKSQKVLRVFGILEIVQAVLYAVEAVQGGSISGWINVVVSLLAAYLLLAAAKDASKAGGAWIILLVDVILSVLELVFALNGGADGTMIVSVGIAIVLNLIAFIAANNVKKQGKR